MNAKAIQVRDTHFDKVEITDWKLVRWLRANGWDGEWTTAGNSNTFTRQDSYALAVVFYDNAKSTREVWLRREINETHKKES